MSRIPNVSSIVLSMVRQHFESGCYVNQVLEVFQYQFPELEHKVARVKVDKSLRMLQKKGFLSSVLDVGNKRKYLLIANHSKGTTANVDLDGFLKELKRTEVELAATRSEWEYLKSINASNPLISELAKEIALEVEQHAMNLTGKYSGLKKIISRVSNNAS